MPENGSKRLSLSVEELTCRFGLRVVFRDISFQCSPGQAVCIAGPNGSGKSTLLKTIAGLVTQSAGSIVMRLEGKPADSRAFRARTRMVAPDLQLYDELTGFENLSFFSKMSGYHIATERASYLLASLGLVGRGKDFYGEYSSGMKARLKLAVALASDPEVLLLDEPTANLDDAGREIVYDVIDQRKSRGIVIYATNDQSEFRLGGQVVRLG